MDRRRWRGQCGALNTLVFPLCLPSHKRQHNISKDLGTSPVGGPPISFHLIRLRLHELWIFKHVSPFIATELLFYGPYPSRSLTRTSSPTPSRTSSWQPWACPIPLFFQLFIVLTAGATLLGSQSCAALYCPMIAPPGLCHGHPSSYFTSGTMFGSVLFKHLARLHFS